MKEKLKKCFCKNKMHNFRENRFALLQAYDDGLLMIENLFYYNQQIKYTRLTIFGTMIILICINSVMINVRLNFGF